jgi:macrolide-specific efflux system membrane fusion protein
VILGVFIYFKACTNTDTVNYLTEPAHYGDISKSVTATGEVSPVQLVDVGAQVSGQIKTLAVTLGQEVKKGDLIAEIDSTTQQNELDINKAKLNTYRAQLAARELAFKVAESQFAREKKLSERNAASAESLENAENALAQAQASLDEIRSLIIQAEISVATSETNLGYTRIVAPLDGTVVSIPVEEGQTVNANQTAPTIVQIADLRHMEIKMQISEGDVTKVKTGLSVTFSILSEPDRIFRGVLNSVDPGPTSLTNGTYAGSMDSSTAVYYYGKLLIENLDGALRIGMTTQNTITIEEAQNVLIVPSIAINREGPNHFVVILAKNVPIKTLVTLGISDNMNTQILSGLKAGDQVVLSLMSSAELANSTPPIGGGLMGPRPR